MSKPKNNYKIFSNNMYALSTIFGISRKRVIHITLFVAIGYVEWLFTSIFFLRHIIGAIENQAPFGEIMLFVGICFLVFCILAIYSSYVTSVINPYTENTIYKKLYRRIYTKARNVELSCFENPEFYNKYTMALDGAPSKMTQSTECFFKIIFGIVATIVAFSTMFFIDHFSVLFVISPIIGNFVFGHMMNKVWGGRWVDNVKHNRKAGYVNRVFHLAEFAQEMRLSKIYDLMMKRYDESVDGNREVADKYGRKGTIVTWLQNVTTFALVFEGIMIYASYRAIVSNTMTLAELAIMFTAMSTSSWILIGLFGNVTDAMKNGEFLKYFRDFMEYKEKIPENQDGIIPDKTITSIEFKGVSFGYDEGNDIIKNISFKIEGNKIIAFVGHNGAGKTTLIKLLFRLYDPTDGAIYVNGINIKEYNLKEYRKCFAAAFQDYKVMSLSVRDNILMGENYGGETDKIVKEALDKSGIWGKVNVFSNGIDTNLTKEFDSKGELLSGGEQQKIIVARAFAKSAMVKVFDEPSSALDPIAEYELYKRIIEQSEGLITIFISHRLSSVMDANMILMLEGGEIIERGNHCELMKQKGKYNEMFTKQAENYLADTLTTEAELVV